MDVVFDRTADARVLTCLTSGADASHDAGASVRAISGMDVTRLLDRLARRRGRPKRIRSDIGMAFCGKAMVARARARGLT